MRRFRMKDAMKNFLPRIASLRISGMSLALALTAAVAVLCAVMAIGADLRLTQSETSYNELARIALERELQIRHLLEMLGGE